MTKMYRAGSLSGRDRNKVPFRKDKYGIRLEPKAGTSINYGVVFGSDQGYRAAFWYSDTPRYKNTFGHESLRKWALTIDITVEEHRQWRAICLHQCDLIRKWNQEWEAAGRPAAGVPEPKVTMQ